MYEKLEGKNIVLRKAKLSDWPSMLKNVWSDPNVYKWMLFTPTIIEDDAIDRCKRSIEYQKNNYAYFIALKETNEAVGLCAIKEIEKNRYEECGICIGTKYQGKGYGKQVVELLLDLAFNRLKALDFQYGYFIENEKSKNLAKSFGFIYDHKEEIIRPWDQTKKIVELCLLSKERYEELHKLNK